MKKGLLIVIDGTDGAGKTTQISLLEDYLKQKKLPHQVISFPRYGQNKYAILVKKYLTGEFGPIEDQDPYKISQYYAGDRLLAKKAIEKWLSMGKLVIANRYTSSSKAHMGANLSEKKRPAFFKWLNHLEYEENAIPKEDLTILLVVDPKTGQKNVLAKESPDLHEKSLLHLKEANKIYLKLSKSKKDWKVINCMKRGQMKSKADIHKEIVKIFDDMLLSAT